MVELIVNLFSIVTCLVTKDYCCYFYIFLQHSIQSETIFENSFTSALQQMWLKDQRGINFF